jgi:hypothetical protein
MHLKAPKQQFLSRKRTCRMISGEQNSSWDSTANDSDCRSAKASLVARISGGDQKGIEWTAAASTAAAAATQQPGG